MHQNMDSILQQVVSILYSTGNAILSQISSNGYIYVRKGECPRHKYKEFDLEVKRMRSAGYHGVIKPLDSKKIWLLCKW